MYIYKYIYMYIYRYRYVYTYIYLYIPIYTYIGAADIALYIRRLAPLTLHRADVQGWVAFRQMG